MTAPDGILIVDKPAGMTSHDVVAAVRRRLPRKTKVGHTGTLDPFATGVLPIVIGKATRLSQFLTDRLMQVSGIDDVRSMICLEEIKPPSPLPVES